jgi:hypothetical protein
MNRTPKTPAKLSPQQVRLHSTDSRYITLCRALVEAKRRYYALCGTGGVTDDELGEAMLAVHAARKPLREEFPGFTDAELHTR